MDRDRLRACSSEDLIRSAGQLAAALAATHAALLEILSVVDERELWRGDGCCSFEDWISFSFGISRKTAHEWVDAARALTDLPHLAGAFAGGELSWDKVRAVTAMASPECDQELAEQARTTEVRHLQRAAHKARAVSLAEAESRHQDRFFAMRRSVTTGGVRLSGFLPDGDGETLIKAIERLAEEVPKDPETGLYATFDRRCADALVDLASSYLASEQPVHGERAMVVAHVDLSEVPGEQPHAETESGMTLAPETVARMMCDAVVEPVFENDGRGIGIGRQDRRPPQWLRRQLVHRDLMCRFPGCTRMRLVHEHHMEHWPAGGPTQSPNLVTL
ncbi:MAG TPA: DUF222 domain-containing protein, partial [Actinomycetota bacterium]|nr:DUF222 domain-containing protein [Actinomycetota bacterium]